jgi:hypothetical protein
VALGQKCHDPVRFAEQVGAEDDRIITKTGHAPQYGNAWAGAGVKTLKRSSPPG